MHLLSVASATAPHPLPQAEAEAAARAMFAGRYREFERLAPVFANAGVRERQTVEPLDWYARPQDWPSRTRAYLQGAEALFLQAARKALSAAGVTAAAVDAVVTVSSTGVATPTLDARLHSVMGFRADVARVPVFGLGCAGAVSGLALASRLAEARPGTTVLFVAVELCSLAFRLDELNPANMVATALFGDGAAACVVRSGGAGRIVVEGGGEHLWPDTLDIMGWSVDPLGFGVILARSVPPFAEANIAPVLDAILGRLGLARGDVDRFVCHPGGAKVILALEAALGLADGALDAERRVLADHGNMSAPTVLFILERVLKAGRTGRLALSALGPGFTASGLCLKVAG